ncbi:MAG: hypothetical protein QXQ87_09025 [Halobacteria archaeon]
MPTSFRVGFPEGKKAVALFTPLALLFTWPLIVLGPAALPALFFALPFDFFAAVSWLGTFNQVLTVHEGYYVKRVPPLPLSAVREFGEIEALVREGHILRVRLKTPFGFIKPQNEIRYKSRHAANICQAFRDAGFTKIEER